MMKFPWIDASGGEPFAAPTARGNPMPLAYQPRKSRGRFKDNCLCACGCYRGYRCVSGSKVARNRRSVVTGRLRCGTRRVRLLAYIADCPKMCGSRFAKQQGMRPASPGCPDGLKQSAGLHRHGAYRRKPYSLSDSGRSGKRAQWQQRVACRPLRSSSRESSSARTLTRTREEYSETPPTLAEAARRAMTRRVQRWASVHRYGK